jgi:hypothetical protein
MTPIDALSELLGMVGANQDAAVLVNAEELRQWPDAAVKALKSQKLIVRTRPASSVICPGCEDNCIMPVHTLPKSEGTQSSFIVCDNRSDINRVPIPAERLIQWKCSAEMVRRFVAVSLGLRRFDRQTPGGLWEMGMVSGDKRRQMLCLKADGTLKLVTGSSAVPLAELIDFQEGKYSLDEVMIRRLVDSTSMADNRYTPSNARREARKLDTQAMYERWQKEYRTLQKKHRSMSDVWISRKIAKMDIANCRSAETIRKNMKK